ncbi:protein FAM72A-like [Saccoglossus kowalevskii]|uniref:Protein FAM72A-like n=1 Tax=Saccoglossus kowalevskii TaxID=10224 RepID=A0ABM0GYN4_SACKO|nr:PREDICTED: protein FAM72A-like [Saccoglossus kowalevskii]
MSKRYKHPAFKTKPVQELLCKFCENCVCRRGMKAILLADTNVELFSTDFPPKYHVDVVGPTYITSNCNCRIRDVACTQCGNIVGYHVILPCTPCMQSCNNGHFWMFHSTATYALDRVDNTGCNILLWGKLPETQEEDDMMESSDPWFEECYR